MFIKKALLFITLFFNSVAMELPPSHEIKKIIKRWDGQEQYIGRIFKTAADSSDSMPFRANNEELIAIVDDKEQTITTYCKNEPEIKTSYGIFIAIMDCKEELKKTYNRRDLEQNKGFCSVQ